MIQSSYHKFQKLQKTDLHLELLDLKLELVFLHPGLLGGLDRPLDLLNGLGLATNVGLGLLADLSK